MRAADLNWCPTPEPFGAELQVLLENPLPHILEIGANDGEDTLRLVETFPAGRFWCFEPDPRPIARFRSNIKTDNVVLVEKAVCAHDGYVTWYASHGEMPESMKSGYAWPKAVLQDWDLSGSICKPTGHTAQAPWCTFDNTMTIPCIKLDTWFTSAVKAERIPYIDYIRMDVQGAEHLVLAGAAVALQHTRYLYTEFNLASIRDLGAAYPKEHYEGQCGLDEILQLLPAWEFVSFHSSSDVLLRNKSWTVCA